MIYKKYLFHEENIHIYGFSYVMKVGGVTNTSIFLISTFNMYIIINFKSVVHI